MLAATAAVVAASCDFGGVMEVARPPVERADVTLTLVADSLPEAAERLGWGRAIPDAEVTLASLGGSAEETLTARTDAQGRVFFEDMETGAYRVRVSRLLTGQQIVEVGVTGVTGAFTVNVRGPTTELELAPLPMLRRELVISEVHFDRFFRLGVGSYQVAGFLEVFNNSDTTIYLDGKLIGRQFSVMYDATPCEWTEWFRTDPEGIWALEIHRFPGSGGDFPLEQGESAVIATDAIDHSEFFDFLLDLSGADFEFTGPQAPDNPAVPNMIDVGPWRNPLGHGMILGTISEVLFLSDAVGLDELPRSRMPTWDFDAPRIPRDKILDVVTFGTNRDEELGIADRWCHPWVHPNFDRDWGPYILGDSDERWLFSANRRVAAVLPDGRKVLQHSRTSAVDFYVGERTPGWIPAEGGGGL
jgi:hypothetical protein